MRLAYYYPDSLDGVALPFLAQPRYDYAEARQFIDDKLVKTVDAKKRKELFDAYVREFGAAGREGLREALFDALDHLEAHEQNRIFPPSKNISDAPRGLLIELFGTPQTVKASDKPTVVAPSTFYVADVIKYGLTYDRSVKIDRAVCDILAKTTDNKLALACMNRLLGRGYDADIEAYYARRKAALKQYSNADVQAILAKAGWTPLHVAVWRGERERIAELIREGCKVNVVGKDGQSPLHVAAVEGNAHAIPILIAAGADQRIKNSRGQTAVAAASSVANTNIVKMFVDAGSPIPDILVAATAGNADEVTRFLRADKASQKAKDSCELTPLHRAALEGHTRVMKLLLDAGAVVDALDKSDYTPLMFASALGKTEVCRMLLQHNAQIDLRRPRSGVQAIHLAAANGRIDAIKLLVERGAKVEAHDDKLGTPLQYASEQGHLAVIEWLISQKADINAKNKDGWSARMLAVRGGHKRVAELLLKNGAEKSPFEDY